MVCKMVKSSTVSKWTDSEAGGHHLGLEYLPWCSCRSEEERYLQRYEIQRVRFGVSLEAEPDLYRPTDNGIAKN